MAHLLSAPMISVLSPPPYNHCCSEKVLKRERKDGCRRQRLFLSSPLSFPSQYLPFPRNVPVCLPVSVGFSLSLSLVFSRLARALSFALSISLCVDVYGVYEERRGVCKRAMQERWGVCERQERWGVCKRGVCKRHFKGQKATLEQVPRMRQQWGAARLRQPQVRLRPPLLPAPAPCNKTCNKPRRPWHHAHRGAATAQDSVSQAHGMQRTPYILMQRTRYILRLKLRQP